MSSYTVFILRKEVEESTTEGNVTTKGSQTVHDGKHTVFTDTITEVATTVVTKVGRGLK